MIVLLDRNPGDLGVDFLKNFDDWVYCEACKTSYSKTAQNLYLARLNHIEQREIGEILYWANKSLNISKCKRCVLVSD